MIGCAVKGCRGERINAEFCAAHEAKVPAKWRQSINEAWESFTQMPRHTPFHDRMIALKKYGRAIAFATAFANRRRA